MDQFNIDAMFDDMLGELDIISQQLDETSEPKSSPVSDETDNRSSSYSQNSSDTSSSQSYSKPPPSVSVTADDSDNIDLSAMLNDLTDWQHNLTSAQGQMPEKKSASQDSGIGFNGNSLPRNTTLSAQYGIEGSPQFNTLKRATNSGPTVTFEDSDDLSLASLEKDIEHDKREQDKARQLSAEELAALSPVMQELDDLVNDLSNLSFQQDFHFEKRRPSEKKTTTDGSPSKNNNTSLLQQNGSAVHSHHQKARALTTATVSPDHSTNRLENNSHRSGSVSSQSESVTSYSESVTSQSDSAVSLTDNATLPTHVAPPPMTKPTALSLNRGNVPFHNANVSHPQTVTTHTRTVTFQSDNVASHDATPPRPKNLVENAIKNLNIAHQEAHSAASNSKPPVPPPVATKPKPPEKPEEREERIKAEKMRIALEKLKEARIQKLVVKVYNKDDSSKTLVVDERMTTRSVIKQLLEKNHYEPSINWALIEELPSLFMERIFEEHESVTEMLTYWTRDTTNQVRFLERKDKYALFRNPQHYLLSTSDTEGQMAERQKQTLIEEFFSGRSGTGVPEVQGILYMKGDSKSWSRKYCVLRTSGLYCSKSGEPKKGKKVSDLQCLVMFEQVCVYLGRGWKKKHKSPTDYGFALKHPAIQTKSKHIKYFCCEDVRSLMRWIVGIRCAKYGKQLKDNYDKTNEEMKSGNLVPTMPFRAQQSVETSSTVSTDSGEPGSQHNSLPRANLSNMFEGAWQRANQQENSESRNEGPKVERAKSVWKPQQNKASNWWDLSEQAAHNADEEGSETATISNRTSDTSNIGSVISNHRASISSTGSRGSYKESGTPTFIPPSPNNFSQPAMFSPPPSGQVSHPPPPPSMMGISSKGHIPPPAPFMGKGAPPPPPGKPMPPAPPKKDYVPPPPAAMNKPARFGGHMPPPPPAGNKPMPPVPTKSLPPPPMDDMPPPPMDDMPPPPPSNDFMPPPPPMEDLPPPPPLDDDMPLPPPMEVVSPNPGLPKGLRPVNGQAPVRLPMLPIFKNGNAFGGLRPVGPRGPKPGAPPPPPKNMSFPRPSHNNYNYSNNKPPLLPRDDPPPDQNPHIRTKTPSFSNHVLKRTPSNPNYRPPPPVNHYGGYIPQQSIQAPLTQYYNSHTGPAQERKYKKDDFPPPPEFILDLKDSIHQVNYSDVSKRDIQPIDLPPPPPELLLNEVKNRKQPPPPPCKSTKPAPPPPKRSPSTKLSFKRH